MLLTNPFLYRKTLRLSVGGDTAYAIVPKPVGLRRSIRLVANPASMAVSGKTVSLRKASRITAPVRTYAITPVASRVLRNRKIIAGVQSFTTTPRSAILFKSRVAGFVLTTYAITGQSVALRRSLKLTANPASMTVTPRNVGMSRLLGTVSVITRAMAITAQSIMLRATRKLTVTNAGYVLAGQQQKLLRTYPLVAAPAAWTISGQSAALKMARKMDVVKADWVFAQPSVTLTYTELPSNLFETNFEAADSVSANFSLQNGSISLSRVTGISGATGASAFVDGVSAGSTGSWWAWDTVGNQSNFDLLVKIKRTSTSSDGYGVLFRASASTAYGYRFGGTPLLVRIAPNGGTISTLATQSTQLPTQTNFFWLRINANGSAIKVRTWQDGTSEPGTWAMEVTDTNYTTGKIGLRSSINNCDWYVDWMSISTAGTPATYDGT